MKITPQQIRAFARELEETETELKGQLLLGIKLANASQILRELADNLEDFYNAKNLSNL
jgi:hypothetical protein